MKNGTTTRKVDKAVQDLFTKGVSYLYQGRDRRIDKHKEAMEIFKDRMHLEHKDCKFSYHYAFWDEIWCYKITTHNL